VLAGVAVVVVLGGVLLLGSPGRAEVEVAVAQVTGGGDGSTGITANGYVVARTKASVSSRISGRLAYLGVTEGSVVVRGQVIARLDNADYAAAVAQAQANVASARAALLEAQAQRDQLARDLVRAEDLQEQNLIPAQQVEDLGARLAAAEARVGVQEAQGRAAEAGVDVVAANLENTYIRAPFDGTVLRKDAEVGEVVAPVATGGGLTRGAVVTMADLETLEVEVDVNEAYIAQVRNGQPARITLDAYPDTAYHGAVRQVVPTADRQRATVQVKVSILDRDPRILPEMAARVDFLSEAADSAEAAPARIFVPAGAVRDEAGEAVVWVVTGDRAARRAVNAGPVSGGRREIRSGLSGGERVVVAGHEGLEDGATVRVREPS
jgi:RND family efflux transporter MFP subunit